MYQFDITRHMEAVVATDQNTARRLGVHEAKRWLRDSMGYEVIRYMLNNNELTNHAHQSEYLDNGRQWQTVTYLSCGNHTLVINHTDRRLYWQD